MLPRSRKIKGRRMFDRIYKSGRRTFGNYLTIFIGEAKGKSVFTIVISKKVSKKAVVRNKLKRRAYSIIASQLSNLKDNHAVVLSFKKEAESLSYQELEKNILDLFKKAKLFL